MLKVTNLANKAVPVVNIQQINRKRKVNGDRELNFVAIPDESRPETFAVLDNESAVTFENDVYIIKSTAEKSVGDTSIKTLQALNEFTDVMINCFQYELFSGSQTFFAALTRVFENTPYTFSIVDTFLAEEFENFGRGNCLALFEQVLERYQAEFRLDGQRVYLEQQIGEDKPIQFRWAYNVKAIDKQTETKNLATVIRGYGGKPSEAGVYPLMIEHRSDNESVFGEKIAEPIFVETITTETGMKARLKRDLIDEPQLSITVDITSLGVENGELNEGDRVYIVYEPMNITVQARVVELDEVFQWIGGEWKVVATAVTLSNIRNKLSDINTKFSQTSKRLERLFEGRETLPYSVLPEAVRLAAEAINNSLTEIQYPPGEGIVLIDPTNTMNRVRLTSAGIGLSTDGGITYRSALTGAGIVTNELVAGIIRTNNIQIVGENDLFYWNGEGLFAYNPNNLKKFVRLNSSGLYIAGGAITIEREDGYKVIDNGMSVFDVNIQSHEPDFRSDPVDVVGYWYRTYSLNEQNCNYFRYRHQARYLKVEIGAANEGGGTTVVSIERGSEGVGNREVLATYRTSTTDYSNELTLTVDLGVPTGEERDFYIRLKTTNAEAGARVRVRGRWLEG